MQKNMTKSDVMRYIKSCMLSILLCGVVHAAGIDKVFEIGREYGIRPSDLQAMSFIETERTYDPNWSEGNGQEHGLYCINLRWHKLTIKQCKDPEFATRYVCKFLLSLGYKKDRMKALKRFNGSGKKAERYARVVDKYSKKFEKGG